MVPDNPDLQRCILELHHNAPTVGHPGRWKTFELVACNYWWSGLSTFVKNYVEACDLCLRTKTFPSKPSGPLMPNAVPEGPWQVITADLITGLPKSEGFDSVAVVVDRFTKQVHLSATNATLSAEGLADLYIRDVFKLHRLPKQVISDRGPQFVLQCGLVFASSHPVYYYCLVLVL